MSLVAAILLQKPIALPAGRVRPHYMDKAISPSNTHRTRLKNIDLVTAAVQNGAKNLSGIVQATGLCKPTVNTIVLELLSTTPPAIKGERRGKGNRWHFEAIQ